MLQKIVKATMYTLVFLLPLFFLTFSFEAFEFNKTYLLLFLVSIGFLASFGRMVFEEKRIRFRTSPLDLFVLLFLVVAILNAVFSIDKTSTIFGFYGRFWPNLIGVISLVLFYFLITNNVTIKKGESEKGLIPISSLVKTFLWSSLLAVVIAYLSLFEVWPKIANSLRLPGIMRLKSFNTVGGSFEALAMFLGAVLVLALVMSAFRGIGSRQEKEQEKESNELQELNFHPFFLYVLIFLISIFLVIVDFWPVWLMISVALILFVGFAFWKRVFREDVNQLSLSILFLIISLIFLFGDPLRGFLNQVELTRFLPKEIRLSQGMSWEIGLKGLKENPVFGVGAGSFSYLFNKYKPQSFLQGPFWQIRFDRAGNFIAEMIGTTGIFGILSFLALLGMFILISWLVLGSFSRVEPLSLQAPLILTFLALVVGQFVYTQNVTLAFAFWLFLGLSCLSWDKPQKEKKIEFRELPELGLIISIFFWAILLGAIFFYFTMIKYYIADVYYKQFLVNPSQNLAKLEKAVRLNDARSEYHSVLARGYLLKISEELSKPEPNKQLLTQLVALSIKEGRRATEVSPKNVAARETLGVVYREIQGLAQGALEWGIKTFRSALEADPKNPVLMTELGRLLVANDQKKEARDLFNKALKLKPNYVPATIQLAMLDESENKIDEAIKRMEEAVKTNPFSIDARFHLGRLYYNNKEYDKAETQLTNALLLFPNHLNSMFVLGLVYEKKGQKEKAIEQFEKILELAPNNEQVKRKLDELKKEKKEVSPLQEQATSSPETKASE